MTSPRTIGIYLKRTVNHLLNLQAKEAKWELKLPNHLSDNPVKIEDGTTLEIQAQAKCKTEITALANCNH